MIFTETKIKGAFVVDITPNTDDRGFFSRSFCRKEFDAQGLSPCVAQCNISLNHKRGTIRGMHFQSSPHEEAKLVRCTRGEIFDVVVDLRPDSSTHTQWVGVRLDDRNHRMLYVPPGCAHGFQSLTDDAELMYQVSEYFAPSHAFGYRHDDPAFGIEWPLPLTVISQADRSWPPYTR
jgi:dTDP-4-dehydrorhamnose 3,5-epimerase